MVRLVLFDIDGTLIRTGGAGVRAFGRVADIFYGVPDAAQHLVFHGRTDTSIVRQFLRSRGLPDSPADIRHFLDAYVFLLDHQLELDAGSTLPGVQSLLRGLRELAEPPMVGLLTGNIRLGAEIKLRAHSLWDDFEMGGFADDHEDRNQIARVARERGSRMMGRRRDLPGDQVVVIGDTPLDVECAHAIGARCLAVATGDFTGPQLKEHKPRWVVPDLSNVDPMEICK